MTEPADHSKRPHDAKTPERGLARWLGPLLSAALIIGSILVLRTELADVTLADIEEGLRKASGSQLGLAIGFTLLSYLFLAGYDSLAIRQLGLKLRPLTVIFASFTSYAISFTLGFPLITAGTVRFRIYSASGVSSSKVMSLTLIAGMTFILGMAVVVGIGLMWQSEAISAINQATAHVNQLVGMAVLSAILVYLVWTAAKRRHVRIKHFLIELPTLKVSIGQLALGAADVCAAAAVLYVLLPEGHGIAFETFAAVYAFGCILGVISNVPGGFGVLESTILGAFSTVAKPDLIGALLLFRLCYYLGPFVIALISLGIYEIVMRLSRNHVRVTDH
jgi:glycosyltransferase 2 family protein